MAKRKTYTSAEVKNRYNAKHYDRTVINLPAGGAEELRQLAGELGLSVSAYIRSLVMRDARARGRELSAISGHEILESWTAARERALKSLGLL